MHVSTTPASRRVPLRLFLETVLQDARYALRTLRRDLGFTTFAVLIVGLGLGASTTVFSLVNGVLLKPMPFKDPSRLVWISNVGDNGTDEWRLQVDNYLDLKVQAHTVADMAGYVAYYGTGNAPVTENGGTLRFTRVPVTCSASTLSYRTAWRSGRTRSGSAWRLAPRPGA